MARLSEDIDVTVLLLEAGGSDWGNPYVEIPGLATQAMKTDIDWGYAGELRPGLYQGLREEVGYIVTFF